MKYNLFIGRFQPLHDGHIRLIRTVLNEGKNVLIALRNTPVDENNPYTIPERIAMFMSVFDDEIQQDRLKIIKIPDIEAVCYGRKVGYDIRQIRLDENTENISATKIRGINDFMDSR